jgi:hypothetical protein
MKDATRAPVYAMMYHGLCDTARKFGYALAIHGTVTADLDLIAVPWIDDAAPAETMVEALRKHINAVEYPELLRRQLGDENLVQQILARRDEPKDPEQKPHGRRAWNLYLDHGGKVDLSVMPRAA